MCHTPPSQDHILEEDRSGTKSPLIENDHSGFTYTASPRSGSFLQKINDGLPAHEQVRERQRPSQAVAREVNLDYSNRPMISREMI